MNLPLSKIISQDRHSLLLESIFNILMSDSKIRKYVDMKNYIRNDKLHDFHGMVNKTFGEMIYIQDCDCGGIKLILDVGKYV